MNQSLWLAGIVEAWAEWMKGNAWQVAVFGLIVWCVARVTFRSSAAFRYGLWLLLFVKLVLPPTLASPWSLATLSSNALARTGVQLSEPVWVMPPVPTNQADIARPGQPAGIVNAAPQVPPHALPARSRMGILGGLMVVWACGAAAVLVTFSIQYRGYVRRVMRDVLPVPPELVERITAKAGDYRIRRSLRIVTSSSASVPAVFGVLRPVVLLPQGIVRKLAPAQFDYLIGHELAHIKRHDVLIGWLTLGIVSLYWFHPVVWMASVYLRREREMACDDKVLNSMRPEGKDYAAALVKVAESFDGAAPAAAGFLGLLEITDNLLHRVRSVLDGTRRRQAGWSSGIALAVIMLFVAPMSMWPQISEAQQPAAPAAQQQPALPDAAQAEDPNVTAVNSEIQQYYSKADPETQEYIRWTAKQFGRGKLWLPENAFDGLTADEREKRTAYTLGVLDGEYGRHQCEALAAAGVFKDKRLLPGVLKAAAYHRPDGNYDCRAKWMAVAALGRIGDESCVPTLISLVDHGNQNTRLWARASLARITGQGYGADKQAWGKWWKDSGKKPAITPEQLEPWKAPDKEKK